ncbi:MAG TPA: V-type ATP synthase subunit B [Candidatus Latescibacteria bacterium]|nr:V-type ATP synthase subunit B [Candidatus Latescibacterota bacterium]HOF61430.1 V-type ATP synthase subunit B [Candidatus Latescibacterota bacterium]HOM56212.1 V-type ATP synthase subunit B [Candidatus Latescibacterota bacterium]HOS65900.1 V-type ATP synthase subunit B [Candidatus Latescibacterota bacterium]HOT36583.1 V-type ATP synthase subunit B [Candidatus Latescibacterota bacterium]
MATEIGKEYVGVQRIVGPLVMIEGIDGVGYDEMVEIVSDDGKLKHGRVLEVGTKAAVVQVFEHTTGLSIGATKMKFLARPVRIPVSEEMLGRTFNALAEPIDGGPPPIPKDLRPVSGAAINPTLRHHPSDFIQTGISAIDAMSTLVRGQKLPVFSASGLEHDRVIAQIIRQAKIIGKQEPFAVVFGAMGLKHDIADFYRKSFEESGAGNNVATFLTLADDPSIERIITPRSALTLAEYLAFDVGMHVLVVLTDMTNYCEALREVATAKGEVPSRKGYPAYLYSDLAALYERAGQVEGRTGSITQLPLLTMPNEDITHPIPDLTGYITEGQIVLSKALQGAGIYPPINVLPSLSRLMNDGIGEGRTREDHRNVSSQLYAAYARVKRVEVLAAVIGEEELSEIDKQYLTFGQHFEKEFIQQAPDEDRSIEETLNLGWKLLKYLPVSELTRVKEEQIAKYLPKD